MGLLPAAPARGIPVERADEQHSGCLCCLDDGDCCAKQGFKFLIAGRDELPNDVVSPIFFTGSKISLPLIPLYISLSKVEKVG